MPSLQETLLTSETILYDLEYTAWAGSKETGWSRANEHREIVEIGAIKIAPSADGLIIIDSYSCLVLPKHNPVLSDYFIELTGITQQEIDTNGLAFPAAFDDFMRFSGRRVCLLSFGMDDEILMENLDLNQIYCAVPASRFLNYRAELCTALNIAPSTNSADLPRSVNLSCDFDRHRAMGDVMAQLAVLNYALKEGLLS